MALHTQNRSITQASNQNTANERTARVNANLQNSTQAKKALQNNQARVSNKKNEQHDLKSLRSKDQSQNLITAARNLVSGLINKTKINTPESIKPRALSVKPRNTQTKQKSIQPKANSTQASSRQNLISNKGISLSSYLADTGAEVAPNNQSITTSKAQSSINLNASSVNLEKSDSMSQSNSPQVNTNREVEQQQVAGVDPGTSPAYSVFKDVASNYKGLHEFSEKVNVHGGVRPEDRMQSRNLREILTLKVVADNLNVKSKARGRAEYKMTKLVAQGKLINIKPTLCRIPDAQMQIARLMAKAAQVGSKMLSQDEIRLLELLGVVDEIGVGWNSDLPTSNYAHLAEQEVDSEIISEILEQVELAKILPEPELVEDKDPSQEGHSDLYEVEQL